MGQTLLSPTVTAMFHSRMQCLLMALMVGLASSTCSVSSSDEKAEAKDPANYQPTCIAALEAQVRIEFEASLQYILMASHLDEDTVNLPRLKSCSGAMLMKRGAMP